MTAAPDETLVLLDRWHRGDRAALETLLSRNLHALHALVRTRLDRQFATLRLEQDSTDLVNEVALRVLEYTPAFRPANGREFLGLLARMVQNLLTSQARAPRNCRRESYRSSLVDLSGAARQQDDPPRAAEARERSEDLKAWQRIALEFLDDPLDRELVLLHAVEEWTWSDIGLELGLSADAARARYRRLAPRLSNTKRMLREGRVEELLAN